MRLIHFRQLEILLVVVESSENIASSATVRKLLTSSRFIARVRRRCWGYKVKTMSGDSGKGCGKPLVFCNQGVALHANLWMNDKLRVQVHRYELRLLNSYATCLINAVNCMQTHQRMLTRYPTQKERPRRGVQCVVHTSEVQAPEFEG